MQTDSQLPEQAKREHVELPKHWMQEKLEQSKLDPEAQVDGRGRPQELPKELEQYLTITNKPYEVFDALRTSREHRLRLLLRRFTNQIQYGCRNSSCDATTCLSYRKRHATTPLRPYTDVAARALAWHCAEQYADSGNTQLDSEHSNAKRRAKGKTGTPLSKAELCWNTPVVPWYEDPSKSGRWRTRVQDQGAADKDARQAERYTVGGKDSGGDRSTTSRRGSEQDPNLPDVQNHGRVQVRKEYEQALRLASSLSENMSLGTDNGSRADNTKPRRSTHRSNSQRHVAFAEPVDALAPSQKSTVKDVASFTQVLYDTASMKEFDRLHFVGRQDLDPSHLPRAKSPSTGTQISEDSQATKSELQGEHFDHMSKPREVSTFKVLPLSTILWLRLKVPHNVHTSPHRDYNTTIDHGPYSTFARQSLHFCLSSPRVLLRSASTWHFIHPQPFKIDEDKRAKTISDLAAKEAVALQSSDPPRLAKPPGIMIVFGMLIAITSVPEVLNHLFAALQHSYILPPWLKRMRHAHSQSVKAQGSKQKQSKRQSASKSNTQTSSDEKTTGEQTSQYLTDYDVSQLCVLAILALQLILQIKPNAVTLTPSRPLKDFAPQFTMALDLGVTFPSASLDRAWSQETNPRPLYHAFTARLDIMDESSFQRLLDSVLDVISHRQMVRQIQTNESVENSDSWSSTTLLRSIVQGVGRPPMAHNGVIGSQVLFTSLLHLLKSVFLRRWDRQPIIQKRGPVHGTLCLLFALYQDSGRLQIPACDFRWNFITDAFDEIEMPVKWLEFRPSSTQTHILMFPFLFEPTTLVTYFRAINTSLMKKRYDSSTSIKQHAIKFLEKSGLSIYGGDEVLAEIRPNMAPFFVLTIRRSNMLEDTMNQLWRRQTQEILKPLKVRLGKDEGEAGLDHGGVQAEFFRIIFAEALDPDYGMFTMDPRTRMTWFQPGSLEPLYKYQALGILMSLAVYNGVTLPVTFPLAFYRTLLAMRTNRLQDIHDGWPDLARGLQNLLDWDQGDVGEVIARTYEFSYEAYGSIYSVDMTKERGNGFYYGGPRKNKSPRNSNTGKDQISVPDLPSDSTSFQTPQHQTQSETTESSQASSNSSSPAPASDTATDEAPLVTNATREQYVRDYVYWLTQKSIELQFNWFITGFQTCIDPAALSILTPEHLRTIIEGYQHIDIDALQNTATYDDYSPLDPTISWFWEVVRDMSIDQHRKLLEFVTASDRVPVKGIGSIVFIIQKNGDGDERLPSSSTCYGRLLLPKYTQKSILKEKLEKAIENSVGFGSL